MSCEAREQMRRALSGACPSDGQDRDGQDRDGQDRDGQDRESWADLNSELESTELLPDEQGRFATEGCMQGMEPSTWCASCVSDQSLYLERRSIA